MNLDKLSKYRGKAQDARPVPANPAVDHASDADKRIQRAILVCCDNAEERARKVGLDASEAYTSRLLVEQTLQTLFKHEYPVSKFINGGLINIDQSLDPGTEEFGYDEQVSNGQAQLMSPDADDFPTVDFSGKRTTQSVHSGGVGFTISRQDVRRARLGGFNIASEKGVIARESLDDLVNRLIVRGDPTRRLPGMAAVEGARRSEFSAPITKTWVDDTASTVSDLINLISDEIDAVYNDSETVHLPDTVVMPIATYQALNQLHYSEYDRTTAMQILRETHPYITRWEWDIEMARAVDSAPAMFIYRNASTHIRAIMPMSPTPIPAQDHGLVSKVGFEFRWGGIVCPRPKSFTVLTGV